MVSLLAVAAVVYLNSDARHVQQHPGSELAVVPMTSAPESLHELWRTTTSGDVAPVVSPYGVVVTGDGHTATALDVTSGDVRWSYGRTNLPMCALVSGDTTPARITDGSGVHGVLVGYAKDDHCSEITLLDPRTGEIARHGDVPRQRTTITALGAVIVFGGPYAASVAPDLIEVWNSELIRSIQFGDQPTPVKPGTRHLGCEFTDVALTVIQFATLEHCGQTSSDSRLVINYADPGRMPIGKKKEWNSFKFEPRAEFDLGEPDARIVGITTDSVTVLVGGDAPALVVYGVARAAAPTGTARTTGSTPASTTTTSTGTTAASADDDKEPVFTEISRTEIDVPAASIAAADTGTGGGSVPGVRITPTTIDGEDRYSVIGDTLVAVLGSGSDTHWTMRGVIGRATKVGSQLLVPTVDGIEIVNARTGTPVRTLPIDRAGYTGPVDLGTAGNVVIEVRRSQIVAFS